MGTNRRMLLTCYWVLGLILLVPGCQKEAGLEQLDGIREMKFELDSNLLQIAMSPDGTSLAATVGLSLGEAGVAVIDLQSGDARIVYRGKDSFHGPEWSPDGQSLIFHVPSSKVSESAGGPTFWEPPYNIVIVDALTGETQRDVGFGSAASWTNDPNKVIILESDVASGGEPLPIFEHDLSANTRREIGETVPGSAQVTDALDTSSQAHLIVPDQLGMQILDINTGAKLGGFEPEYAIRSPVWSPNGEILAYTLDMTNYSSNRVTPTDHIVLATADGKCISNTLDLQSRIWALDWSPDGTEIAFSTRQVGSVYFLDLTSGIGKDLLDSFKQKCDV